MKKDTSLLSNAIEFAEIAYSGIKRKNGEDYLNHPQRVKKSLEEIGIKDEVVLSAALLHALPQLGVVSIEELEKEFGTGVAYIIRTLKEVSEIALPYHDDKNVSLFHKLLIQLSKDIRVLLIRLADRVDNVKTAEGLPFEDQKWLANKALSIHAPIAKALGIYTFTREMEDGSLKIIDPARYKQIVNYQNHKFKEIEKDLIMAKRKIEDFLKESDAGKYEISFRKKSIYSTHKKALAKVKQGHIKNADDFDNLFDLLGIRVLVENEDICYKVMAYILQEWENIQSEFDDYIANPKSNGYRSLQTAVKITPQHNCEIQVRTFEMHNNNEYGSSSHFKYKYGGSTGSDSVEWIKDLISIKENIQTSIAENSKISLFEDVVFAFTPKGDLITLPKNSTVLDFAYSIHTDIGNKCFSALINGKFASLNTVIKSGDKVEVMTQKNKKPSAGSLEFVQTQEAQKAIKRALGIG